MLNLDPNFKDFIALMNSEQVKYLLLGGYAVNYYGHHRFTADIDFWIAIDRSNAERVSKVLQEFAFPGDVVKPEFFMEQGCVHIFGREPVRVDLLTGPAGVEFDDYYSRRVMDQIDGVEVAIISLAD